MTKEHRACDTCHFWASKGIDEGTCTAIEHGKESICRLVFLEQIPLRGLYPVYRTMKEPPTGHHACLVTPKDFFCASWQERLDDVPSCNLSCEEE